MAFSIAPFTEDLVQLIGDVHLAAGPLDLRHAIEQLPEMRTQQIHVRPGLVQQMTHGPTLLVQQGRHDVSRFDVLVIAPDREGLRVRQGELEFAGEFVHAHEKAPGKLGSSELRAMSQRALARILGVAVKNQYPH
jgi:hypothetical protein